MKVYLDWASEESRFDPASLGHQPLTIREAVAEADLSLANHFEFSSSVSYDAYMAEVGRALEQKGGEACDWLVDNFPRLPGEMSDVRIRLYLASACIFLFRAQRAVERGELDIAWYFVSESAHWRGKAEGDYSVRSELARTKKQTSPGGRANALPTNLAKAKAVCLMMELAPPDGWKSPAAVVQKIGPALRTYVVDQKRIDAVIGDLEEKLLKWLDVDPVLRAAFKDKPVRPKKK
ncbi:Uncharacterised protein [Burkholderia pseudomallei]|uniref:hypothetical protein n=1 Tax=Burkholderia pseudomallei TaxID=28450 RepID=UPI000ADBDA52|nr:hypothetical protein [Burkholderia pseudomallei]NAX10167.1 hypothetical protein [Burkholderia pseudomallei]NAX99020.1 hypothetical protein [Burkholderia pseudomallei]NAY17653.1 hypothetical protein [Burkholderia pseudomallei]NAY24496.1 hypothetical protein [Burkholderia pseudomallei]NAY31427.1 hypothetical protein [Burkholderia pseudomallei]